MYGGISAKQGDYSGAVEPGNERGLAAMCTGVTTQKPRLNS